MAVDGGPRGSCASWRAACPSAICMVLVSLVSISGATAAARAAGLAVAKLNPLFAAARSADGLILPKNFCASAEYMRPAEPSMSKPAAVPLMSPKSRYVLATNCVCAIPSCGKSATSGAGALNGLFGAPTGSRIGGVVTLVGLTPGAYETIVVGLSPSRNG